MKFGKISPIVFKKWKRCTLVTVGLYTMTLALPFQQHSPSNGAKATGFADRMSISTNLIMQEIFDGAYKWVTIGVQHMRNGESVILDHKEISTLLKVFYDDPCLQWFYFRIEKESKHQWASCKSDFQGVDLASSHFSFSENILNTNKYNLYMP